MGVGVALVLLALLISAVVLGSTHTEYDPVTLASRTVQGTPTPADILIGVVGLVLAGIGFGQRLLNASERR
jgi:hypothetical protein